MNLTIVDIERIRKLRYEYGLSSPSVAAEIGCHATTVRRYAPGRIGKIPNDKLREAFESSGLSASEVARRMGWTCSNSWTNPKGHKRQRLHTGDGSRVRRTLGITPDTNGQGYRSFRYWVDAETAQIMAEVMGLMAWEVMPDDEQEAA